MSSCQKQNNLPAWDLSDIYSGIDDEKIMTDMERYKKLNVELAERYKGKLANISADDFLSAIEICEATDEIENALGCYAYLNMVTQMNNKDAVAFYQNVSEKMTDYSKSAIFFSLEINSLSQDKIDELFSNEKVAFYKPFIKQIRVFKPYELSEDMEQILQEKSLTSSAAWVRLYEETSSKLKYSVNGKEYNDAEIGKLLLNSDRSIREEAGKEINRVAGENSYLFSFIYNMIVKDKAIGNNKRGFKSPISSKNLANSVEDDVVVALTDSVKANYSNIAHRFYKLKAKWLNVEKIQYWDRNAPLPFSDNTQYSWEKSVDLVLKAYESFSPKLRGVANGFFENSWIDVPPRDGKRSGAFAMPMPAKYHPYLLLNFVGKQNDVLTLAHELGHGCHMLLSQSQGDLNDSTPLTLSEVASVFGEMITFQSMLKNIDDDKQKLCLIASKVNDMINTAIRQIAFHLFETRVHDERKSGEVSEDRLCQIWIEEMKSSLGEWVNVDENSEYIWLQISHFFGSPFYVYAYSFADCLVNSLYQVYTENKIEDFESKYLEMLSLTGVKKYDELLTPFGLDAKNPEFWNKGLSLISSYIDQLEELDKKLGL